MPSCASGAVLPEKSPCLCVWEVDLLSCARTLHQWAALLYAYRESKGLELRWECVALLLTGNVLACIPVSVSKGAC